MSESPKQLGVLRGAVNPPSGVKGQSPRKFLGFSVLNTLKICTLNRLYSHSEKSVRLLGIGTLLKVRILVTNLVKNFEYVENLATNLVKH